MKYTILQTKLLKLTSLLLATFVISACTDFGQDIDNSSRTNITGVWQYEQINQEFDSSFYKIGIKDNGNQVTFQNCLSSTDIDYNRSNDLLINNDGQKLRIKNSDTIESISVPDLRKLEKIDSNLSTFTNAGSVIMESNGLPTISATSNVCAQKITTTGSDKIHLRVSVPFEETYMYIELEIEDINTPDYNISKMSFFSPSLKYFDITMNQRDRTRMEILHGKATLNNLTGNRIQLDYDVTIVERSVFPGADVKGTLDINF